MKRFFNFLIGVILGILVIVPIASFATEMGAAEGTTDYNNIFTRIWEFVEANKSECVSGVGSLILLIAGGAAEIAIEKMNKKHSEQLGLLQEDSRAKNNILSAIVDAVNQMITGFNNVKNSSDHLKKGYDEMRAAYELNATKEDDRNRLIGAVMVQNTAILEMFARIYVHNKNMPQGVRDLVILTYANTLKALDDDELLRSIVESVREKINLVETPEEGEEIDPSSEPDATEV